MSATRPVRPGPTMICPAVRSSSGVTVSGAPDVRVPSWLLHDHQPCLLAFWRRDERCPDGRHLWDALIAYGQETDTDPDSGAGTSDRDRAVTVQPFRLVLTCTRCGVVEDLRGESWWDGVGRGTRVHPVPLRAGDLLAQQVYPWGPRTGVRDAEDGLTGEWTVHGLYTGETVIGRISPVPPRRGGARIKHVGRMSTWPDGVTVTGGSPLAALRKLARALNDPADVIAGGGHA